MTTAPRRLQPGDTVAIVSPSAPALGLFPHRLERGLAYLESLGLQVRVMPNATKVTGWTAGSARERVDDLHAAFADEEIAGLVCAIGGNHSNELLPHLDFDLVAANPKLFQGYSDITILHWAFFANADLRTFYGPALVSELAEYPQVLPHTERFLRAAWFGSEPLRFEAAAEWTDERLDWRERADLTRPRELRPSDGWITVREGVAEGRLLGGCLETICWHLKGSRAWLDLAGAIFFLETSEEAPSPAHVDAYLTDLAHLGVFEDVAALVFARPYGYDEEWARALWEVVRRQTEPAAIPVLANVDCGHTSPMLTLPLGSHARLDAGARSFETLEPALRVR
jgi:muramoyltetrapeptide carboxypeptidase